METKNEIDYIGQFGHLLRYFVVHLEYCQNGDLVIGIRYFFDDEQQMEKIKECNNLLVEGFIALGKPNNVYGIMCQLRKGKRKWKILSAYTYKPKYADNIKWLFD